MEKVIVINGGKRLNGTINISGSKNAGLGVLAASVMLRQITKIYNLPRIQDIDDFLKIMETLNVKIAHHLDHIAIDSTNVLFSPLVKKEVSRIRASYYFMGVCLAIFNKVEIATPGGCKIGERPIEQHFLAFSKMGVKAKTRRRKILMELTSHSSTIKFEKVSVGATINALLLASRIDGVTLLNNVSLEPEVKEVIRFIRLSGGYIKVIDTDTIVIVGKKNFKAVEFNLMSDRIEAGTYAAIGVALADNLVIKNIVPSHMQSLIEMLKQMGANMEVGYDYLRISTTSQLKPINITTGIYPLFPTDLQQIFTTLLTQAEGISLIEDTIYEKRLAHVPELIKMGANLCIKDKKIEIRGKCDLVGSNVDGKDLRGGASLVLAGLLASGESRVSGLKYINRGYSQIVENLRNIGADIRLERVKKYDEGIS